MKSRIFLLILFVLSMANFCHAQNLVPNYSFELYDTCPFSSGQIYYSSPWIDPTNSSSDYFNSCNTMGLSVPSNFIGSQFAKDGSAYAGFIAYVKPNGSNNREYIQTRLTQKLLNNRCYELSFYVSIGDFNQFGVNTLSAHFSDTSIYLNSCFWCPLPYTPQVVFTSTTNYIGDKNNWTKLTSTYLANGGEEFLTIGNFMYDSNTVATTISPYTLADFSYYYIDSISVIELPPCDTSSQVLESDLFVPNAFSPNGDGYNDYYHILGNFKNIDFIIYNRWGEKVFQTTDINFAWDGTSNGRPLNNGVYFYSLNLTLNNNKEIELKGNISLLK